jgi:hypothetical protein
MANCKNRPSLLINRAYKFLGFLLNAHLAIIMPKMQPEFIEEPSGLNAEC